jgi:hypothetical protein
MAHTLTQRTEFRVNSTATTQPVLLSRDARPGTDYFLIRVLVDGADVFIGALVDWDTDNLDHVKLAYTQSPHPMIVPDTIFNRRQIEKANSADWTYALLFTALMEVDVIVPINNLVCRGNVAENQAITPRSLFKTGNATGLLELAAGGDDPCGRSLCIIATGTGVAVVAFVLCGCMTVIN